MISRLFGDRTANIRRAVIAVLALGFFAFLYSFNQIDKVQFSNKEGVSFDKAVVEDIIKDNIQEDGSRVGRQTVKIKMLSGSYKGRVLNATSTSGYLYGADCEKGMKVIVSLSVSGDNYVATVYSYNRGPVVYAFVGIFVLILWAIGGKKGFKSVVGLAFTFICIVFLFIPMIYRGYSPFLSAVVVGILVTIVTMYLIDGLTIKSISAVLGTVAGVVIAGGAASAFGYFAKISGYNVSEIEDLVVISSKTNLNIGGILFAGILIASLGAVIDVSMSVASTINEIHEKNPELDFKELFISGINVGKDMMGTMSNTLILAFTGGSINTLLLIYAYNMKYNQVINMYSVGIEIMQGVSGSIGVILTVPIVSFITCRLLTGRGVKKFI
ncbi:YibE/F family protein [Clostridium sp. LBM24168]